MSVLGMCCIPRPGLPTVHSLGHAGSEIGLNSAVFFKLVGRGLFPQRRVWAPCLHGYREQVEQVRVGVDAGRGVLDQC